MTPSGGGRVSWHPHNYCPNTIKSPHYKKNQPSQHFITINKYLVLKLHPKNNAYHVTCRTIRVWFSFFLLSSFQKCFIYLLFNYFLFIIIIIFFLRRHHRHLILRCSSRDWHTSCVLPASNWILLVDARK